MTYHQEQISSLFVAYFNRAAAHNGFEKWVEQLDSGTKTYEEISAGFIEAPEFKETYGEVDVTSDKSLSKFVSAVYQNVLGREGSAKGIATQVSALKKGALYDGDLAKFMAGFTSSAIKEFDSSNPKWDYMTTQQKQDAQISYDTISNKILASFAYSDKLKEFTNITSVDKNGNIIYNEETKELASNILSLITHTPASLTSTIEWIERLKEEKQTNSISYINPTLGETPTSSTQGVASLESGKQWEKESITYSFNSTLPSNYHNYKEDNLTTNFTPLNPTQQNIVNSIMREIESLIDTPIEHLSSGGMIQLNIIDILPHEENIAGFAFFPGTYNDLQGDIFLNSKFNTDSQEYGTEKGEDGYLTLIHEIGHALGLKHPFEGEHQLPSSQDDINHTIMSYSYNNAIAPTLSFTDNRIIFSLEKVLPLFYSSYDIATLQSLYGVNKNTNKGDNTYSTSYSDYEITTIWDAGGDDTIDLSKTKGENIIDLRDGSINSADMQTLAKIIASLQDIAKENGLYSHDDWIAQNVTEIHNQEQLYLGADNLSITSGVIIENLSTGSANDTITDNEVNNTISSGEGDDTIYMGHGGYDKLDGGEGEDKIILEFSSTEVEINPYQDGYLLSHELFIIELKNIESITFNDTTMFY